jgi:hypothetical protein
MRSPQKQEWVLAAEKEQRVQLVGVGKRNCSAKMRKGSQKMWLYAPSPVATKEPRPQGHHEASALLQPRKWTCTAVEQGKINWENMMLPPGIL